MNKKSFFGGILVTILVIGMIGSAYAQTIKKTIEAEYRDIIIQINGEKISTVDTFGNTAEPFIVDGRTYLPVRAIGEALGLEVTWDDATSTVGLNTKPSEDDSVNYWYWAIVQSMEKTFDLAFRPMFLTGTTGATYEEAKKMEAYISAYQSEKDKIRDSLPLTVINADEYYAIVDLMNDWQESINLIEKEIQQFGSYTTAASNEKSQRYADLRNTYNEIMELKQKVQEKETEVLEGYFQTKLGS